MNRITAFSFTFLLLLLISQISEAQTQQGYYMHIDYVQIPKHDIQLFENETTSSLKTVHEARVDNGSIAEWYIYRVAYPSAKNPSYNYVVISLSENLDGFVDQREQVLHRISEGSESPGENDFISMLIPYRSELWRINNSVLMNESTRNSRYFIMDYMNVPGGMEYAYQMMEDEIARPIHEYRMEIGQMKGWELFYLIAPGGTEYGYNYATGNYFDNLSDFEFGFTEEIIRQSHPQTDINEINQNIDQTRDLVRSEVWELIEFVK